MAIPLRKHTRVLFIALFVLANNLAWIYLMKNLRFDHGPDSATAGRAEFAAADHKCDGSVLATRASGGNRNAEAAHMRAPPGAYAGADSSPAQSPVGTSTDGTDIPFHESQDAILHSKLDREYFFQGDPARKLQTIEALSPQGEAIELLKQILQSDPDSSIRIAALNRLRNERTYAVTALVVHALDDPAVEVSVTALNTLVAAGDRTMIPLLKDRLASVHDQPLREQYVQAIQKLEYSESMAVDGVTGQ